MLVDFKCDICGKVSEHDVKIVPVCCGHDMRRLFGGQHIIFKGSGFYVNDYKNKGASK